MRYIITLALILTCMCTCLANKTNNSNASYYHNNITSASPKTIVLYTWNGTKFNQHSKAYLIKTDKGYYINFVNTSKYLPVFRNQNRNGFNSWSVDNWGIYYYYNI